MDSEHPGSDLLEAHRAFLEALPVAACLWMGDVPVAGNAAARALWQSDLPESPFGFAAIYKANGRAWEGWRNEPSPTTGVPQRRIGQRADGSRIEWLSFSSVLPDPSGHPAGILEILVPLSAATVPKSMVHDLTNAIGIILGNTDLALTEFPPEHAAAENLQEIRNAALQARTMIRQAVSGEAAPEPSLRRPRVLWIDDDDAFLLLADRALRRLGCDVRTVVSPEDVPNGESDGKDWDLIVIDNNLLGRDGLEVARQFLQQNSRQRICMASGVVDDELAERAREIGVCRVITKPATVPEFAEALGGLIAGSTRPPGLP
jgi:CheY-like chemotaxis protein